MPKLIIKYINCTRILMRPAKTSAYLFTEQVPELDTLDGKVDNGRVLLHEESVLGEPLDVQDYKPRRIEIETGIYIVHFDHFQFPPKLAINFFPGVQRCGERGQAKFITQKRCNFKFKAF